MSTILREPGIILRTIRHGETSLVLTVFTRGHGKIGLIAKGARSHKKNGTALGLEIFTEAEFVIHHKFGRELQILKEASLTSAHLRLRDSLDSFTLGSAVIELLNRCLQEDDPHSDLFDAATETLAALDTQSQVRFPLLWKFEIDLCRSLGFALQLSHCAATGKLFATPLSRPVSFRYQDGTFSDGGANESGDGVLTAEAFAILLKLSTGSREFAARLFVSPKAEKEIASFLSRYLETHLPIRGRLRSLEALRWSRPHP